MLVSRVLVLPFLFAALGFTAGSVGSTAQAAEVFVAGVHPDRRPEGAPRITAPSRPQLWYVAAVKGVVAPYPPSLFFLDNQGDWYTPFNRPGMTGRYDIRGWHNHP